MLIYIYDKCSTVARTTNVVIDTISHVTQRRHIARVYFSVKSLLVMAYLIVNSVGSMHEYEYVE